MLGPPLGYGEGQLLLLLVARQLLMGPVTMWLLMGPVVSLLLMVACVGLLVDVVLDLPLKLLIAPKVLTMANLLEIAIRCWMRWSLDDGHSDKLSLSVCYDQKKGGIWHQKGAQRAGRRA